ncbi:hypothetical protein CR205_03760 [Alteribacter lacisalsi]|uniref:DUF4083 domain-containing protein n=1 Tax=Alteribacter lacisalsi TaxID=2045244 RepID=A0A2W0H9Y2_9BACI|nr:hypothetical protein [Alteribacter lacisalsi]PYZ97721.1 hypothetical protein CR205_03760 [Alteribacter lacisalsi]
MLLTIEWGDVLYQVITLILILSVLIGIPALIVFFVRSARRNSRNLEEIRQKLEQNEKQN